MTNKMTMAALTIMLSTAFLSILLIFVGVNGEYTVLIATLLLALILSILLDTRELADHRYLAYLKLSLYLHALFLTVWLGLNSYFLISTTLQTLLASLAMAGVIALCFSIFYFVKFIALKLDFIQWLLDFSLQFVISTWCLHYFFIKHQYYEQFSTKHLAFIVLFIIAYLTVLSVYSFTLSYQFCAENRAKLVFMYCLVSIAVAYLFVALYLYFNQLSYRLLAAQLMLFSYFGIGYYFLLLQDKSAVQIGESEQSEHLANIGSRRNVWSVFIYPSTLYLFGGYLSSNTMLYMMSVLALYYIVTHQYQNYYLNNEIIQNDLQANQELEEIVAKRTAELRRANQQLKQKMHIDHLTNICNRLCFYEHLYLLSSHSRPFALCYLDLDRFKVINDIYGHSRGDEVLIILVKRLIALDDAITKVARVGGDEFAIVLESTDHDAIILLCQKVLKLIRSPIRTNNLQFHLDASIGIAKFPTDSSSVDDLIKYADIAMYQVKHTKNRPHYVFFEQSFANFFVRQNMIENALVNTDYNLAFDVYYQPIVSATSQQILKLEALLRWRDDTLGEISPKEFIAVAEKANLIFDMTCWLVKRVCNDLQYLTLQYGYSAEVTINISPLIINHQKLLPMIIDEIKAKNINSARIELEITENFSVLNTQSIEERFREIKDCGFKLALDDFGTGYSSLEYIRRFPIDTLKIAKEIIDHIDSQHSSSTLINAILLLSQGLSFTTVAEGVETVEQLSTLIRLGCDLVQGYYFSRPQPLDSLVEQYFN